jgi:CelD/BcsL family acetyltransferase involved in cellulose biosynthesis
MQDLNAWSRTRRPATDTSHDAEPHNTAGAPTIRTVGVRDFDNMAPHIAAWDRLACEAPQRLPTLFPAWVNAYLRRHEASGNRWLCCFAYLGDRLVGVLPVEVVAHPKLGHRWPVLNTCSDIPSGDILLAPDRPGEAFQALLAEVGREEPEHLGLNFKAVRQNSPLHEVLRSDVPGYLSLHGRQSLYWFLNVEGNFESYLAGIKNMRSNLRRYRKKLENRGKVTVEIRKGASADDGFLSEFLALEASGWKGRSGGAILCNAEQTSFFSTLVKNFTDLGRLEWHLMRLSDRVVAAKLILKCGNSLIIAKSAFDEDLADCRLGTLLTAETLREAFSRPEIVEVNSTSESDAYGFWHMPRDSYVDIHLVRLAALPMLAYLPGVAMRSAYHAYLRPRIPAALRASWRHFKRKEDSRPRRAADVHNQRKEPS